MVAQAYDDEHLHDLRSALQAAWRSLGDAHAAAKFVRHPDLRPRIVKVLREVLGITHDMPEEMAFQGYNPADWEQRD